MRILAFDPGVHAEHFAYAALTDGRLLRYGNAQPISTLRAGFDLDADRFAERMAGLVAALDPELVLIERFMDRGGGRGTNGEFISIMLGLLHAVVRPRPYELIAPATWKNWWTRAYWTGRPTKRPPHPVVANVRAQLVGRFPQYVGRGRGRLPLTVHQGDAIGMAVWRHARETGQFDVLDDLWTSGTINIST